MAEKNTPMKQLQELLQDEKLRQQIQAGSDEKAVLQLLVSAGAAKGYQLNAQWLKQAFDDVRLARRPTALTDKELSHLASTYMMSDTPPKLCHTDSCGGHPDSCC
jgi:hypothetical protein